MPDTELRVTIESIWREILSLTGTTTQLANQIRWLTIASLMLGGASVLLSLVLIILLAGSRA